MGICFSNNNDSVLLNLHDVDVEMFSLNGMTFNAKVVDVYDGDTCTVIFYYKDEPIKFKCRCKGYDSPEMKPPKDAKNRDDIIKNANLAKNFFINQTTNVNINILKKYDKKELKDILNKNTRIIKIKTYEWDKYGRLLADFYYNNVNLNELMIKEGHGYSYDGGTKKID